MTTNGNGSSNSTNNSTNSTKNREATLMTGKRYYITTLGAWRAHAPRFANSHFIVLDAPQEVSGASGTTGGEGNCAAALRADASADATPILVLVEGDEGAHLALEDEPAFEALPHPLAQKAISPAAQAALAGHGVAPGATAFEAAEAVARIHPLLRHRVF
jgi:hypothetical protein